jgi:uncharacterized Zn finger protein
MPRENAKTRAVRLLTERRVMIHRVSTASVLAQVRGDSGELREVRWDPRRGWSCSCPAIGLCAHGHAVASVVVVPPAVPECLKPPAQRDDSFFFQPPYTTPTTAPTAAQTRPTNGEQTWM